MYDRRPLRSAARAIEEVRQTEALSRPSTPSRSPGRPAQRSRSGDIAETVINHAVEEKAVGDGPRIPPAGIGTDVATAPYLERPADHASTIAGATVFMRTGGSSE